MNALKKEIIARILRNGPMRVDEFMALCLADPDHGYYFHHQPFGATGDFVTAPEISQLFGEMLAIWVYTEWLALGKPEGITLCELGPGRGTLMDDLLRTLKTLDADLVGTLSLVLIETAPRLAALQQQKLGAHQVKMRWEKNFSNVSPTPSLIIANELFDALPIRQFIFINNQWYERLIAVNDRQQLHFGMAPTPSELTNHDLPIHGLAEGTIYEAASSREALMVDLSRHVACYGGAAAIIDYGSMEQGFGDSLQSISRHRYRDIFAAPGHDDLTSHVDFKRLAALGRDNGCAVSLTTQGQFLLGLGLLERAGRLGHAKAKGVQHQIQIDVERLAGADQMGTLFKVLTLSQNGKAKANRPLSVEWLATP